jgi:two-component system, response regulator
MNAAPNTGYVLIADDDLDDIEILTTALKEMDSGLQVVIANNGRNALEQLNTIQAGGTSACVLVMDMNMPKMDGRETVVAIKNDSHFESLPILLFSTAKSKTDEMFAQKWGVHFFQKPDTVQGLNDVAKVIIGMCREKKKSV